MTPAIIIYRSDGSVYPQAPSFSSIVIPVLEQIIGTSLKESVPEILVYPMALEPRLAGEPVITNISYNYGYARVKVFKNHQLIYEHPHTVKELVAEPLQQILKQMEPAEQHWGFYLMLDGMPAPLSKVPPLNQLQLTRVDNKPSVKGAVDIKPYGANERPLFGIKRVIEEPLPKASLDNFKITLHTGDENALVKVLVHENLYTELDKLRPLSHQIEEGGFLVGQVYEDSDAPATYLVELTAAVKAEHTGASLLHFTYTGDSFSTFNNTLRRKYHTQRLIGWYHTHLFPATNSMGLSSIDVNLHATTFRQPWQIAGLINLDAPGKRTLRFYVRQDSLMVPCSQWIILSNC